jgi:TRAP-type C4-dicarboxylate transport system permease small subunit
LEGTLDMENMEKLKIEYDVVFTEPDKGPMIAASMAVIEAFAADKGLEDVTAAIDAAQYSLPRGGRSGPPTPIYAEAGMFRRFIDTLDWLLERIVGLLCIVLLVCLFVEVMNRYIFFVSWPEIQFIVPFCFLLMCMLGAAIAARKGQHFEVDLLHKQFHGRAREAHHGVMMLTVIAGGLIIAWSSNAFVDLGLLKKNPATGIRLIDIYTSLLLGGGLIALFGVERLLNGQSDSHDHNAELESALHEIDEARS